MIKKIVIKKLIILMCISFTLVLLYFMPDNKELSYKTKIIYTSSEVKLHDIFLLDSNNRIALTNIAIENEKIIDIAREIIEILIKDGKYESKIPSGFRSILPSETKINNLILEDDILKIDLSSKLFEDINKEYEEKIIESLIYSLTSIKGINKIIIFIDGKILTKLPISGKILPSILDRDYGINKIYDLVTTKDITNLTIYYIDEYNDNYYYVPVTKFFNDKREKIEIIIEELASSKLYTSDLMSFLDKETKLLSNFNNNEILTLEFNDAIFNDMTEKTILEEVTYSISLSVFDAYDVKEVVFTNNNEEICKKGVEN